MAASLAAEYCSNRMESSKELGKKPSGGFKKFQKGAKKATKGNPTTFPRKGTLSTRVNRRAPSSKENDL
ncbi:hypothetical protein HPB48_011494 [Haemaphysalis longicornis]|uniref:Uncharacterized protein n=1 Tax=Haemaphysalis longicornis TaxID=44386 RepID=A0A9J6GW64_HAELO|nr:hypothetical protein HPB48_011494 [Haemaphysalis longicornis]